MSESIERPRCPRTDKQSYVSYTEARSVIRSLQRSRPKIRLRAYECPTCRAWHLSSGKPEHDARREC